MRDECLISERLQRLEKSGMLFLMYIMGYEFEPGAKLQSADLPRVDLTGVDVRGADLSFANLQGANLSLATLLGTDFTRAELRDAVRRPGISRADMEGATGLASAKGLLD